MLFGIPGNVLSVIILYKFRHSQPSIFLECLAMADLNVLCIWTMFDWVGNITEMQFVNAYEILCRIQSFGYYSSLQISSWMQVLVTTERVCSVVNPHKVRTLFSQRRSIFSAAFTAAILVGLNCHFLFGSSHDGLDKQTYCFMLYHRDQFYRFVWPWIDISVGFLIPCLLLVSGNFIIVWQLKRKVKLQSAFPSTSNDSVTGLNNNKISIITKRVIILNVVYIICICPICVYETGFIRNWWIGTEAASSLITMLMLVNNSTNFFLYIMLGSRFRHELLKMKPQCDCNQNSSNREITTRF